MVAIVNTDQNWGIGKDNDLLFSIPEDLHFFRVVTTQKVVVMGRTTLASMPGGRPLKNRINIVLTHDPDFTCEGAVVCHTPQEVRQEVKKYPPEDVFVIGGESVYRLFLPDCEKALVTRVNAVKNADRFFPNLEQLPEWGKTDQSELKHFEGLTFTFCTYTQKKKSV